MTSRLNGSVRVLPYRRESLVPWLAAAVASAVGTLLALRFGSTVDQEEQAALVVVLAGTVASTGLLASRSSRQQVLSDRDERARPVPDELAAIADADPVGVAGIDLGYVVGMQRWTSALLELFDHAAAETADGDLTQELAEAAEDTRAMHDLLMSNDSDTLSLRESAMLHSVAMLWETGQERIERLAADVDMRWYRRWHARTLVQRRLRHGVPRSRALELPYG